jgi:hypothetical protein
MALDFQTNQIRAERIDHLSWVSDSRNVNFCQATTNSGFCKERRGPKHMELLGIGFSKFGARLEEVNQP